MCCELGNGFRNQLFGTKAKHRIKPAFTIHVSLKRGFNCFVTTFPPAPGEKTQPEPSLHPDVPQQLDLLPPCQMWHHYPKPRILGARGMWPWDGQGGHGQGDQEQPVPLTTEPGWSPRLSRVQPRPAPALALSFPSPAR